MVFLLSGTGLAMLLSRAKVILRSIRRHCDICGDNGLIAEERKESRLEDREYGTCYKENALFYSGKY